MSDKKLTDKEIKALKDKAKKAVKDGKLIKK